MRCWTTAVINLKAPRPGSRNDETARLQTLKQTLKQTSSNLIFQESTFTFRRLASALYLIGINQSYLSKATGQPDIRRFDFRIELVDFTSTSTAVLNAVLTIVGQEDHLTTLSLLPAIPPLFLHFDTHTSTHIHSVNRHVGPVRPQLAPRQRSPQCHIQDCHCMFTSTKKGIPLVKS